MSLFDRQEAENLAREIASFPQTCMRNDRRSTYEQLGMALEDAMNNEFDLGVETLGTGEFLKGSSAFSKGKGKHGKF